MRRNLLRKPEAACLADMELALAATARAFPIPAAHRKDLPAAVRDLSRMLTQERGELSHPYWSQPRYLAAYLHYFLPWNLYRLSWLLPDLPLNLPPAARILDLGSGPLTLPLALWCSRPDLRATPLSFLCVDSAAKPMETGLRAFTNLAGESCPWRIELFRGSVEKALRSAVQSPFSLIMAGNVLNELCTRRNTSPQGQGRLEPYIEELVESLKTGLAPAGQVFIVEPGTRLGGKLVARTRNIALTSGMRVLAPCPHSGPCPMAQHALYETEEDAHGQVPGKATRTHSLTAPSFSGWCHFTLPAYAAPEALARVSAAARLEKESLSLSCLLLEKPAAATQATSAHGAAKTPPPSGSIDTLEDLEALYQEIMEGDPFSPSLAEPQHETLPSATASDIAPKAAIRVISAPIRLPGQEAPARYGCCEKGLCLLLDALRVPSGAYAELAWPGQDLRDRKTGALILSAPAREAAVPQAAPRKGESPRTEDSPRARQARQRRHNKPHPRRTRKNNDG